MITGVLKGTRVKDMVYGDDPDQDYIKVLDPGTGMKPEGTPWFIPVRLFDILIEDKERP